MIIPLLRGLDTPQLLGLREAEHNFQEIWRKLRDVSIRSEIAFVPYRLYLRLPNGSDHRALLTESLARSRKEGQIRQISNILYQWGDTEYRLDGDGTFRAERAEPLLREALQLAQELKDKGSIVDALEGLGNAAVIHLGDRFKARAMLEEAAHLFQEIGNRRRQADCYGTLGTLGYEEGQYAAAQRYYESAVRLRGELQLLPKLLTGLMEMIPSHPASQRS